MKSIISIVGAAAVVSLAACAHAPNTEATATPDEAAIADAEARESQGHVATQEAAEEQAVEQAAATGALEAKKDSQAVARNDGAPSNADKLQASESGASAAKQSDVADGSKDGFDPATEIEYQVGDAAIARFVITSGIEDRQPIDEATTFQPGERVYAFVRAINPGGEPYNLHVSWAKDEGQPGMPLALEVGNSPRWRTWARREAPEEPGSYRCLLETEDGELIAQLPFEVVEP